jgi:predicted DCC family thiol-disulfide oxidoreductase YuxK
LETKSTYPALILFDGFCNLCSRSVDFVIKRDKNKIFRYVALQSEAGNFLRDKYEIPVETDSVILWQNGKFFFHSEAALRIAVQLRFPWPLFGVFRIVPAFIRDIVYRWIARNRYRWFGKREVCRIPLREERSLFPSVDDLQLEIARLEPEEKS